MLTITVPEKFEKRVRQLAAESGHFPDEYLQFVLNAGLADMEEAHEAQVIAEKIKRGEEKTYTSKELRAELELGN